MIERQVAQDVTFQTYDSQPAIQGVRSIALKKHRAMEGWFMEHLRLDAGVIQGFDEPMEVRQISFSYARPGRINAFHVHPKRRQDEVWCVAQGMLHVWLIDVRDGSPTHGHRRQHILCGEEPALLYIPSGVAHGYQAGEDGALLIYAMNDQFNAQDPNEGRLPMDYFGAELWEENRG